MKIRDLRQYIKEISDGYETLESLGKDSEQFLQRMYGQGHTLNGLITSAASFANNAHEQLFYEFVQNAYDANADSLFFYANNEYLIVLNNGEPFYTDIDIFPLSEDKNVRDGQLYNFLAKGKSLKIDDPTKLGQYGQGSKLLYTLLTEVDNMADSKEQLKKTIIEETKGPYLISWHNIAQLDALLINGNEWTASQADDVENNLLFAKILMSYYPIAPGQAQTWFSNDEAQSVIRAFHDLVDPPRNKSFLTQGTAIIIPLGDGKYERITSEKNIENVKSRLGVFASITADQEENDGHRIKHIYVMGDEVQLFTVKSEFEEFEVDDNKLAFHFAFNPQFADINVVNFFKGLPILQSKYRFGFILDSQNWDVDDSRQRLTDIEKACEQFKQALHRLFDSMETLKVNDKSRFDYIYNAIVESVPASSSDEEKSIRMAFYQEFRPFMYKYMRTTDGQYVPFENTCIPSWDVESDAIVDINLQQLGIENLHWISEKDYNNHTDKNIRKYYLAEMLEDADDEKLSAWILSLSHDEYKNFHKLCMSYIDDIEEYAVFKSNQNKLYSWEELQGKKNVYYQTTEVAHAFTGQEVIVEPIEQDEQDYYSCLFAKIKANLTTLRSNSINRDALCNVMVLLTDKLSHDEAEEIKTEWEVLQNRHGEYVSCAALFTERLTDTILFDNFVIQGSLPLALKGKDWFVNNGTDFSRAWSWVVENFDALKKEQGWGKNTDNYINDIKKAYSADKNSDKDYVTLYLDEDGVPTETPYSYVSGAENLSEVEYQKLTDAFANCAIVPFKYRTRLSEYPFSLSSLTTDDLVEETSSVDYETLRILNRITDSFFLHYRVSGEDNQFEIEKLRNGGKNYFNNIDSNLQSILNGFGFYHVPVKAQQLLSITDNGAFSLTRQDFARTIIDKVDNLTLIYPLVQLCEAATVAYYFEKLTVLDVSTKLTADDIKWKIIKLAVKHDSEDNNIKENLFDAIRHKGERLPQEMMTSDICVFDRTFNLYELDSEYEESDELVNSFFSLLPSATDADWFKQEFYGDNLQSVEAKELYDNLKETYLTVEQLRFCLAYSLCGGTPDYDNLEIQEASLKDALDMIKEEAFKGFNQYFQIAGYDSEQVFASEHLLTEEERLPQELHDWLNDNPNEVTLFDSLRTERDTYVMLRKATYEDVAYSVFEQLDNEARLAQTLQWLTDSHMVVTADSNRYKTLLSVIDKIPEQSEYLFLLRYTGEAIEDKDRGIILPIFTIEELCDDAVFLSYYSWTPTFKEMLLKNKKIGKFFTENSVYLYEETAFLDKWELNKYPRLSLNTKAAKGDYKEYKSTVYEQWKKLEASKGYKIKTSNKPIGVSFALSANNQDLLTVALSDRDYGYVLDDYVVVRYPNEQNASVLKCIENNISDMYFFQTPFIALQGLLVEQIERLQEQAEEKGVSIEEIIDKHTTQTASDLESSTSDGESQEGKPEDEPTEQSEGNVTVDDDKKNAVQELADYFDEDELQEIADKKDKILEVLHDMENPEDETNESQVRSTIGYIGELIYERYLQSLKKEYKYAAIEGVGDYDFHNKTDMTYVDVKTTLYSLKDGTAPFYLHRSQNTFMQKHPKEQYRIIRISLIDLNLKKAYETIRDTYGKDANPLGSSDLEQRLNRECQKIADKYWKKAQITEFDAVSPEYAIRIEKKDSHG